MSGTTTGRQLVPTSAPWASVVGYSRAVRVGNVIHVAGTAPIDDAGRVVAPGDPYLQARRCLEIIIGVLREAGAGPEHVVRTRIYVTDIGRWEEVGRAHGEFFGEIRPATSMVEVSRLISPEILVEIEADAYVAEAV